MPQQYPFHQQQQPQQQPFMTETFNPNDNNTSNMFTPRQPMYNNYSPQYPIYQPPQPSNNSPTNNKPDFQRFYGPVSVYTK